MTTNSLVALRITEPKEKSEWDLSKTNTITWSHVDSDPKEFMLVLVDKDSSNGAIEHPIGKVSTADGKYDLTNFVVPRIGDDWSVKALGTTEKNLGQLAESEEFEITKSGGESMR